LGLEEFQKEQQLQMHVLERELASCAMSDDACLQAVAERIAQVAYEVLINVRFGVLGCEDRCAVFVNMGQKHMWLADRLAERVADTDSQVLARAHWPTNGPSAGYSFAILVDSEDAEYWRETIVEIYSAGPK
jgi:hypothetical protein